MYQRVVDRVAVATSRVFAWIGGLLLFLAAILVSAEVVLRNLAGVAVLHSFELTNYLFATAVAFGLAHTLACRSHIRIDILYAVLPALARALLDLLALVGMTALGALYASQAWRTVALSADLGAVSNTTLAVPLVIPQGLWALGLTWFTLVAALLTGLVALRLRRGDLATVTAYAGVAGDGPGKPGDDR